MLVSALVVTAALLGPGASPAPAALIFGTGRITGANTAITAGWRATPAGAEFLARCTAAMASGGSAVPASNGVGAWVIDLTSDRTGLVSVTGWPLVMPLGPAVPTPDPTGLVFQSPTFQLYNFDLDLYFVSSGCSEVGSAATQAPNESGDITSPARYVVVLLAFNATGSPTLNFDYWAP